MTRSSMDERLRRLLELLRPDVGVVHNQSKSERLKWLALNKLLREYEAFRESERVRLSAPNTFSLTSHPFFDASPKLPGRRLWLTRAERLAEAPDSRGEPLSLPSDKSVEWARRIEVAFSGLSNIPYLAGSVSDANKLSLLGQLFGIPELAPTPKELPSVAGWSKEFHVTAVASASSVKLRLESVAARVLRQIYGPVRGSSVSLRGSIKELTEAACARLRARCFDLQAEGHIPKLMLTLTYPGEWESCCPYGGRSVKRHFAAMRKRLNRYMSRLGLGFSALWFLEFQARGAPHIHLILWGDGLESINLQVARRVVARAWAGVVDHQDSFERSKHLKAGTRLEEMRSPHFGYAVTYASKPKQKEVPEDFRSVGRFWGTWSYVKPDPKLFSQTMSIETLYKLSEGLQSSVKDFASDRFLKRLGLLFSGGYERAACTVFGVAAVDVAALSIDSC